MPKLPRKATLDLEAQKLYIDGEEFPWYITEEGVEVSGLLDNNSPCVILTFSMLVDTAEVIPAPPVDGGHTISTETAHETGTNVYGAKNV